MARTCKKKKAVASQATGKGGLSALHAACQNGHVDVIKVLLSTKNSSNSDIDVTCEDGEGRTALHMAASLGHSEVVQVLLKDKRFGSRIVNRVDKFGDTALMTAVCNKHTEVVDVLLASRHVDHLRPNSRHVTVTNHLGEKQRWPAGLTALHLACVTGNAEITAVFAKHGRISPNSFVVFPGSPLDAAVVGNNPECVRLVHQFVPMNSRGFEGNACLHMAAHCSSIATLDCLLELGADTRIQDDHKNTVLGIATSFRKFLPDRLHIIDRLVSASRATAGPPLVCIPDSGGNSPLHLAASVGDAGIVEWLLKQPDIEGAARNNAGSTALHKAVEEHVRMQRVPFPDPPPDPPQPALEDWLQCICHLLQHPKAVQACGMHDNNADTPLHIAAAADCVEVCKALVEAQSGCVEATDKLGRTPVMVAIAKQAEKVTAYLVKEAGASCMSEDKKGWTALHYAAHSGDTEAIAWLAEAHKTLDVNHCDRNRMTALHAAAYRGHDSALLMLRNLPGCDVLAGRDTLSPAHCVCASGSAASAQMIYVLMRGELDDQGKESGGSALQERLYLPESQWRVCPPKPEDSATKFQGGAPLLHSVARSELPQQLSQKDLSDLVIAAVACDPLQRLSLTWPTGQTALHVAVRSKHFPTALALLDDCLASLAAEGEREELIKAADVQGNNVLHLAAEVDARVVVERVLHLGVKGVLNARNSRGETPLVTAARCGGDSVALRLLMHGWCTAPLPPATSSTEQHSAPVETSDHHRSSCATLSPGAKGGPQRGEHGRCGELVEVLAVDTEQRSALHWAAEMGHTMIISSLLTIVPRMAVSAAHQADATSLATAPPQLQEELWLMPNAAGKLAIHVAVENQQWLAATRLVDLPSPDLRQKGYDGRRLVDVLRSTPVAQAEAVRTVLSDEAFQELLEEASERPATRKSKAKSKSKRGRSQRSHPAPAALSSVAEDAAEPDREARACRALAANSAAAVSEEALQSSDTAFEEDAVAGRVDFAHHAMCNLAASETVHQNDSAVNEASKEQDAASSHQSDGTEVDVPVEVEEAVPLEGSCSGGALADTYASMPPVGSMAAELLREAQAHLQPKEKEWQQVLPRSHRRSHSGTEECGVTAAMAAAATAAAVAALAPPSKMPGPSGRRSAMSRSRLRQQSNTLAQLAKVGESTGSGGAAAATSMGLQRAVQKDSASAVAGTLPSMSEDQWPALPSMQASECRQLPPDSAHEAAGVAGAVDEAPDCYTGGHRLSAGAIDGFEVAAGEELLRGGVVEGEQCQGVMGRLSAPGGSFPVSSASPRPLHYQAQQPLGLQPSELSASLQQQWQQVGRGDADGPPAFAQQLVPAHGDAAYGAFARDCQRSQDHMGQDVVGAPDRGLLLEGWKPVETPLAAVSEWPSRNGIWSSPGCLPPTLGNELFEELSLRKSSFSTQHTSQFVHVMSSGVARNLAMEEEPDLESIVRQAGIEDEFCGKIGQRSEQEQVPEWASEHLVVGQAGSFTEGQFAL